MKISRKLCSTNGKPSSIAELHQVVLTIFGFQEFLLKLIYCIWPFVEEDIIRNSWDVLRSKIRKGTNASNCMIKFFALICVWYVFAPTWEVLVTLRTFWNGRRGPSAAQYDITCHRIRVSPFRLKNFFAYKRNKANLDPFHMCFTI